MAPMQARNVDEICLHLTKAGDDKFAHNYMYRCYELSNVYLTDTNRE